MRPSPRSFACLLACLLLVGSIPPALAAVPDPFRSHVDPCLVVCPYGDIAFQVIVRDAAGNPVVNSTVFLEFTACVPHPDFPQYPPTHLCPSRPSDDYTTPSPGVVFKVTDIAGNATFHLRAGGVCPGTGVRISADGLTLAFRGVASPDQDGSLAVLSNPDATILVAKQTAGGYDVTADLDCDLDTNNDAGDIAVYDAHAGHACDVITPARRGTWGAVKITYR